MASYTVKCDTPLSAIILAGGESIRMGQDKAWITTNGDSFISVAINKLRKIGIEDIFISGRIGVDYSLLGCPVLHDLEPGMGPLAGIERGLRACNSPLLLILAVDLPQMTSGLLKKLAKHSHKLSGVVPIVKNKLEPLVAIYPKRCHAYAVESLLKGRHSVKQFVELCLKENAIRTWMLPNSYARCFMNCNTPSDVEQNFVTGKRSINL